MLTQQERAVDPVDQVDPWRGFHGSRWRAKAPPARARHDETCVSDGRRSLPVAAPRRKLSVGHDGPRRVGQHEGWNRGREAWQPVVGALQACHAGDRWAEAALGQGPFGRPAPGAHAVNEAPS